MTSLPVRLRPGDNKTVLVTNGTTGGALAAAKPLAAAGFKVITMDYRRLPLSLRSRYSSENHVIPAANQAEFERGLLDLLDRTRPDAFLPLGSRSTFIASKNLDRIRSTTAVNVPSLDAFMAAYDKAVCMNECQLLGIPCPIVYSPEQAIDVWGKDRAAVLVVKPDSDVGAAEGVYYVRDREQLCAAVRECTARFASALIQEYIPGGAESMKSVVLLFSPQSRLVAAFTTRKLLQWPQTGGLTAIGCSTADERLVTQVLPFFEKWRWCGGAEVELKFDHRTGQDKVIEINPRLPAFLRFPLECGIDFPLMSVSTALDGDAFPCVPFPAYRTGVKYRNPGLVLRAFVSNFRTGGLRSAEFRQGVRDLVETIPVITRLFEDPMPVLGRALAGLPFASQPPPLFSIDRSGFDGVRENSLELH